MDGPPGQLLWGDRTDQTADERIMTSQFRWVAGLRLSRDRDGAAIVLLMIAALAARRPIGC